MTHDSAHLGLNLGRSPMHERNVYIFLNLITRCVSPQYYCRFNDFFETTHHGAPDSSGTICWQQLANLDHATMVPSKVSVPKQRSIISLETLSECVCVCLTSSRGGLPFDTVSTAR